MGARTTYYLIQSNLSLSNEKYLINNYWIFFQDSNIDEKRFSRDYKKSAALGLNFPLNRKYLTQENN